jgi:photosystem II stability/assembly factor-like uncharacterized protein
VFKSTDGGATWGAVNAGLANGFVSALAIDPLTPATLYAGTVSLSFSQEGGVFKSTDGGMTWQAQSVGLTNRNVLSLAVDPATPTTLYAGTSGEAVLEGANVLFKSVDGGGTWQMSSTVFPVLDHALSVNAIVIDPATPTTLYAAGGDPTGAHGGGVFKSVDAGATWQRSGLGSVYVQSLAIDPVSPATLYAGTGPLSGQGSPGSGVFKSTDGGATWQDMNTGLTNPDVHALAIDPATPATLYAGTADYQEGPGGVFQSTNGGVTWQAVNAGLTTRNVFGLAIDALTPTTLYVGTDRTSVFKSTNAGATWQESRTGFPFDISSPASSPAVAALAIDPLTPTTLYAGTGHGIFRSVDGGTTWEEANAGLPEFSPPASALAIDPLTSTTLYAGVGGRVFKSPDGGMTWQDIGITNLNIGPINALAIDPITPTTVYAGGYGGGVFRSIDGEAAWDAVNTGLTNLNVSTLAIDPLTPTTLYATTDGGLFKSTDGGTTWGETGLGDASGKAFAIDPSTPTILYARTFDLVRGVGLSKSLDGGATWQAADAGLDNHTVSTLVIDPLTSTTLYAGTFDNGVFRSLDGGATWQAVNTGLTSLGVNTLAVHPTNPATIYAGTTGGVFVSQTPVENDPPRCDLGQAVPNLLWPPNRKLVPVRIAGVTDPEGSPVTITIIRVMQDEPVNGRGDGDTSPDALLQGDSVLLRAARSGTGNGREYRVEFTAEDGDGRVCAGVVSVVVPHN